MTEWLRTSVVSSADRPGAHRLFTALAVVVAIAMFVAASGSGSGDPVGEQPPAVVDVGGNLLSVVFGVLVLLPRTRVIGAIAAVVNMGISMYLNYTVDGVDYFVGVLPYNVTTTVLASILVGHYAADLVHLGTPASRRDRRLAPGV